MIEKIPPIQVLLLFFGFLARTVEDEFDELKHDLRGARMATTYHGYLARTVLFAAVGFLLVLGIVVGISAVYLRTAALSSIDRFILFVGFVFPGVAAGYGVYRFRLYYPRYVANERAREIELSMPNATNFLLALSRAGVPTADAMRVLSDHAEVLGAAAEEFRYAYRDMEYFGADVVTALTHLGDTTFLDDLEDFIDGYLRALTGRGEIDRYLEGQMEDLFEQAEIEQEDFLSSLGVLAEVYVAVFVAGPIFALVILVVMGFMRAPNVLDGIRVVVYAVIPLSAVGYLVMLDVYMSNPLGGAGSHERLETGDRYDRTLEAIPTVDPGDRETLEEQLRALRKHRLRRSIRAFLAAPLSLLRREPVYALYVGAFVGTWYFLLKIGAAFVLREIAVGGVAQPTLRMAGPIPVWRVLGAIDNGLIEAFVIGLLIYTVFYELRSRYLAAIERRLPDFLDELSDRHQIGMSLSESITALQERDMGRLDREIGRMARDFRLRANASDVLKRFANRVRSPVVTRVVVLLAAANDTADRLGPVIEALADRAELTERLERQRRVEMSLYVVIIYLSFLVFLIILVILHDVFLPKVPTGDIAVGVGAGRGSFDPAAYRMLFYHMSVIQGLFSGLVGGKMSEGRVSAGAKHALVLVVISYVVFTVILPAVTIAV